VENKKNILPDAKRTEPTQISDLSRFYNNEDTTNILNNQKQPQQSSQPLMNSEGANDDRILVVNAIGNKLTFRQAIAASPLRTFINQDAPMD